MRRLWPFRRRKKEIIIGGEAIAIEPLSFENMAALMVLMSPYWPLIDEHLPNIEHAMLNQDRPLLVGILFVLRDEMTKRPGDITRAVALLAGVSYERVATRATGQEIIEALPILNEAHDLGRLWGLLRAAGAYLGPGK